MKDIVTSGAKQPEMLSVRQAAARGIMPERALRRLIALRKVPIVQIGRTQYVNYSLLLNWLSDAESKLYD